MAPRPGSTLPPQGGKGGGRPMPPQGGKGTVQQPGQPQVPMAGGKAPGVVQPGQSPYTPIGYPPSQVPAQGGKAPVPMGGMLGGGGNPMQPQQPSTGNPQGLSIQASPQPMPSPQELANRQQQYTQQALQSIVGYNPFNPSLNTVPYDRIDPNQTVPMPPPGTLAYNTYQQTGRLPTYGEISQPVVDPARPGSINPQVAEMIGQGNMQGAMDLQRQLAAQNGKFFPGQPMPTPAQGMLRGQPSYSPTSQEAYNRFKATAKPVAGGSLPSYEQFVQNRTTPNPQRPQRPQMPQPQQRGLSGLQLNKFRNRLG